MNPITMNGYNYANNIPVMNVDPDGEVAWIIASAIRGMATAIFPYLFEIFRNKGFNYKKAMKQINYKKVESLAVTGAFTGILGDGLALALTKGSIKIVMRMFVEFQWELKAELASQYAKEGSVSLLGAAWSAATGVILGKAYVLNRIVSIYKRHGKAYIISYVKRL